MSPAMTISKRNQNARTIDTKFCTSTQWVIAKTYNVLTNILNVTLSIVLGLKDLCSSKVPRSGHRDRLVWQPGDFVQDLGICLDTSPYVVHDPYSITIVSI